MPKKMNRFFLRTTFWPVLLLLASPLAGQVLHGSNMPKAGGTHQGCDSSLVVDFTVDPLGDLVHRFNAVIDTGNHTILATTWTLFSDQLYQLDTDSVMLTYSQPGEMPACLSVAAISQTEMVPCSTTTCRFVDIVQDPSCLLYDPDFTIAFVDGQTVGFAETTLPVSGGHQTFWGFGEIINHTGPAEFTFDGPGPHEICLTLVGPDPYNCSATVCKWLYLGPGDLACTDVLESGFMFFQSDNIVVVLDTSVTSGQGSSVHWDFGDGTTAEGRVAVHVYDPSNNSYGLCGTVELWGPLVNDTCEATQCVDVVVGWAASINEPEADPLRLFPNPAGDRLIVTGLPEGPIHLDVIDATGRLVLRSDLRNASGEVQLSVDGLMSGFYSIQCLHEKGRLSGRFFKE